MVQTFCIDCGKEKRSRYSKRCRSCAASIHMTGTKHALGHSPSKAVRLQWSIKRKGATPWNKGKKTGIIPWNKGRAWDWEMRRKMSLSHIGQPSSRKGKKHTPETRLKMHLSQTASKRDHHEETSIERIVKSILLSWGVSFHQEFPIKGFGRADFYIPSKNLVIECDGTYWHGLPKSVARDKKKEEIAPLMGLNLLRLPEKDIRDNRDALCQKIYGNLSCH